MRSRFNVRADDDVTTVIMHTTRYGTDANVTTEKDRLEFNDVKDEDSQKVQTAEADVMSKIPKPKFIDCSIDGNDITDVPQIAKTSKVLKK